LSQESLSRLSTVALGILIAASVAFHQANLLVALWTLPALGLCALLGWRPSKSALNGLFAGGTALILGMAALVTMNLFAGRLSLSSGGSVFMMARLLEDGTALRYLERVCPERRFAVCPYLDELKSYHPKAISFSDGQSPEVTLSNYFLWHGPLDTLGGFRAQEAEASAIVAGTLSNYPVAQFRAAVANGWRQLRRFRTGDGLNAYPPTIWVSIAIHDVFGPVVYDEYRQSKQIRGAFGPDWFEFLNRIHVFVLIASLIVLFGCVVLGRLRRCPDALFTSIFVAVLVVGNAFTLGVLSGPNDRYQSRVIWLVPLLACGCALAPKTRTAIQPALRLPLKLRFIGQVASGID